MLQNELTISQLIDFYNTNKEFTTYLCFMLQNNFEITARSDELQSRVQEFFARYFKLKSPDDNTIPSWFMDWVSNYDEGNQIVGYVYPHNGEPIVFTLNGTNGRDTRLTLMEYIQSVDPEAVFEF